MSISPIKQGWITQGSEIMMNIVLLLLIGFCLIFGLIIIKNGIIIWLSAYNTHPVPNVQDSPVQIGLAVLQVITIPVLILTLVAIWRSMRTQQKLAAAQLLRDRYDMFFKSWQVGDEDVQQFRDKPYLFVEKDRIDGVYLRKLLKEEDATRKYLLIVQIYEYLAFAYALTYSTKYLGRWAIGRYWESIRNKYLDRLLIDEHGRGLPARINDNYFDPYGEQWLKRWVKILVEEPELPHVHQAYEKDHPEFYRFMEDEIKEVILTKRIVELKDSGYYEQEIVDHLAREGIVDRDNQPVNLHSMRTRYDDYKRDAAATPGGNRLPSPYDYISWNKS